MKGFDYEESLLADVLLIQLLVMRNIFTARSERPFIYQGIRVLIGGLLFTLPYVTAGFYILDGQFNINFSLTKAILQTLAMLFTEDNAGLEAKTRFGQFFANSIYLVGAITLGYALLMRLRPVLWREVATPQQRQTAKQI